MVRMFIRHDVEDYDTWRQAYDDFDEFRRTHGVEDAAVFRDAGEPNRVTVTHDFASLDAARSFADAPELRDAMQEAGVAGPPDIWFAEPA